MSKKNNDRLKFAFEQIESCKETLRDVRVRKALGGTAGVSLELAERLYVPGAENHQCKHSTPQKCVCIPYIPVYPGEDYTVPAEALSMHPMQVRALHNYLLGAYDDRYAISKKFARKCANWVDEDVRRRNGKEISLDPLEEEYGAVTGKRSGWLWLSDAEHAGLTRGRWVKTRPYILEHMNGGDGLGINLVHELAHVRQNLIDITIHPYRDYTYMRYRKELEAHRESALASVARRGVILGQCFSTDVENIRESFNEGDMDPYRVTPDLLVGLEFGELKLW